MPTILVEAVLGNNEVSEDFPDLCLPMHTLVDLQGEKDQEAGRGTSAIIHDPVQSLFLIALR